MATKNQDAKKQILLHCLNGMLRREDNFDKVPSMHADWICERLSWHKVLPLAAALEDPHKTKCSTITRAFRAVTLQNLAREAFYHAQVSELFLAFDRADISYMPFKGPFWGSQIYEAYHWRHIGDIDIIMTKSAAKSAVDILLSMDYCPDTVEGSLEEEFALRGELAFVSHKHRPNRVPVELHWDLMPSPRFLRKRFLFNADFTEKTFSGRWRDLTFALPQPEIQLLYYVLHATCQHQFMRFVHIINIVYFIKKFPQLNWDRIYHTATERGAQTPLYYGLKIAHSFFPLPTNAVEIMNRSKPRPLACLFAMTLRPGDILLSTPRQGKTRRNLFRIGMSL